MMLALLNAGGEVRRDDNYPYRPDLYTREVMVTLYKIEAKFATIAESLDISPYSTWRTDLPVRDRRGWVFERKRGKAEDDGRIEVVPYNKAIAAASRAFVRLEKRGLVKRTKRTVHAGAGIVLTPTGYQEGLGLLKEFRPDVYQQLLSLTVKK